MAVDHVELFNEVFFSCGQGRHALAAPVLRPVSGLAEALDIAEVRHRDHHVIHGNQVLNIYFALHHADFGAAAVRVLGANHQEFLLDHAHQQLFIRQDALQVGDRLLQLIKLSLQPVSLQVGQSRQAHIKNGLGLNIREIKALDQAGLGSRRILGGADQVHHFIDVEQRLEQAFQDV